MLVSIPKRFYENSFDPKIQKEFKAWLKSNTDNEIIMYHGTSDRYKDSIKQNGLNPAGKNFKVSEKVVYLAVYPSFAAGYGKFIIKEKEAVIVVKCRVKISELKADANTCKRVNQVSTLSNSLLFGFTATIKTVPVYNIEEIIKT